MNKFLTVLGMVIFVVSAPAIGVFAAIVSGSVISVPVINKMRELGLS